MTDSSQPPTPPPSTVFGRILSNPWLSIGAGFLGGLVLFTGLALAAGLIFLRPQAAAVLSQPTPAPNPACGLPTVTIEQATFFIVPIQPEADGTPAVPPDKPLIAYWIEGTRTHSAFALSPTPENLAILNAFKPGDTVKITWETCNSSVYAIESIQSGFPDPAELKEGPTPGLTVYMPSGPTGEGVVIRGGLQEEHLETIPTPAPDAGGREAEISLLETTASADGSQILLKVSLLNYGKKAFTLSVQDIQLIPEEAPAGTAPLSLAASDPKLPARISPGETKTFTLTFPKPPTPAATLKIFDVELYFDGY